MTVAKSLTVHPSTPATLRLRSASPEWKGESNGEGPGPRVTTSLSTQRFWSRVAIGAPGDCWYWTGRMHRDGRYGNARISGRDLLAHRAAFLLANGSLTPRMDVMHSCDHPLCCNPSHLLEGTHAENMADMAAKGRAVSPQNVGRWDGFAKITSAQAEEMIAKYLAGAKIKTLARHYSIDPATVRCRLIRVGVYIPRERGNGRIISDAAE